MSSETQDAQHHREEAEQLPDGDIVGVLLRHHADITDAIERIKAARGENRVTAWAALAQFLMAHETAEQQVVHPISRRATSPEQAEARLAEEREADKAIAELDALGADSPDFGPSFLQFADKVHEHAEHEENEEFPSFDSLPRDERLRLGAGFLRAFEAAA